MINFHLVNSIHTEVFFDISISKEINLAQKGAWQLSLTKTASQTKVKQISLIHSDPKQATTITSGISPDLHKYLDRTCKNLKQVPRQQPWYPAESYFHEVSLLFFPVL